MFGGDRSRIKTLITPMRKDLMSPSFCPGLEKVKNDRNPRYTNGGMGLVLC